MTALIIAFGITACGTKKINNTEIIGGADEPTSITLPSTVSKETNADKHFLEYIIGNETDANGDTFWAVGEPDTEYALYDVNGDGINELIVRSYGYWICDIMEFKDNKIQFANVENLGSSGVTFINDKNQFVSGDTGHEGRAIYVVSEINDQGKADIVMSFVKYWDDWTESGSPEIYKKENPSQDYLENIDKFDTITEAEYEALVEEYSKENTTIEWIKMD